MRARLSGKNSESKAVLPNPIEIPEIFVIGRSPLESDLILIPNSISRRHCTFRVYENDVSIIDHSKNGTLVDGKPLDGQCRTFKSGTYTIGLCKTPTGALFEFELLISESLEGDESDGNPKKLRNSIDTELLDFN